MDDRSDPVPKPRTVQLCSRPIKHPSVSRRRFGRAKKGRSIVHRVLQRTRSLVGGLVLSCVAAAAIVPSADGASASGPPPVASAVPRDAVPRDAVPAGTAVDGTLVIAHGDDFVAGFADEEVGLVSGAAAVDPTATPVALSTEDALAHVGTDVTAYQMPGQAQLVVPPSELTHDHSTHEHGPEVAADTAAMATGAQSVLMIMFNFANDRRTPWTRAAAEQVLLTDPTSVAAYYSDVSNGELTITGTVTDWIELDATNASCGSNYGTWASEANAKATANGHTLGAYDWIVYNFPSLSCGWSGLAYLGWSGAWINGSPTLRTIAHELGHNFNVHHASTLSCTSASVRVTYSTSCTSSEYGDPASVMGSSTRMHHARHQAVLGYTMPTQQVSTSGTYTIAPMEGTGSPRLLKIAFGTNVDLWLEYRQPTATFDNWTSTNAFVMGVGMRTSGSYSSQSYLLDATPATSTYNDAPLAAGQTFLDAVTGLRITVLSVTGAGATVEIEFAGAPSTTTTTTAPPSATTTTTAPPSATTTTTAPSPTTTTSSPRHVRRGRGYWMLERSGRAHAFGSALHYGDIAGTLSSSATATDLETTPTGLGYWIVDSAGRVKAFGDARRFGDAPAGTLTGSEQVTSLASTRSGAGYWLFTDRGRALAFGDAMHHGDVSTLVLNGPVIGSIPTPTGGGYFMVASDGGIFAFGDAQFVGSMGGFRLNAPVMGLVPDADGRGYWLVGSDGGIFAFDAAFRGSMGTVSLNRPVVGMVRFGDGYLMVGSDGGIFNFSDQGFFGSLGATPPANPIVAVAVLEE